jgi:hypothetical protein
VRVRFQLLVLPIHRRSLADYHAGHDAQMHGLTAEIEREWQTPFSELPPHVQLHWKDQWYWPPWFFNDAVGFLKIGSAGDGSLAGDLYLCRGCFPPTAAERFSRGNDKAGEIVFFASTSRQGVESGDGASWVAAAERVIDEAARLAREQGDGLEGAEIWRPPYDLGCIDLERADRQSRQSRQSESPA